MVRPPKVKPNNSQKIKDLHKRLTALEQIVYQMVDIIRREHDKSNADSENSEASGIQPTEAGTNEDSGGNGEQSVLQDESD